MTVLKRCKECTNFYECRSNNVPGEQPADDMPCFEGVETEEYTSDEEIPF